MQAKSILSKHEITESRKSFLWFNRFNGAAIACLSDSILVLFVLKAGLPEYLVGILASFIFLTMPFMLIGRQLIARYGSIRTISIAWYLRTTCMLSVAITTFFISPAESQFCRFLIIAGVFGFFSFRSTGLIATNTISGDITNSKNRGRLSAEMSMNFNAFLLIIVITVIIITRLNDSLKTLQGILILGCIFNYLSGFFVSRISETDNARTSARKPILPSFKKFLKNKKSRNYIIAMSLVQATTVLTLPISMVAVKQGYQISDNEAMLFTLVQISGGITISFLAGIISDATGPRPLLLIYCCGFILNCLLWFATPASFTPMYTFLIFALNGILATGSMVSLAHYLLASVKDEDRIAMGILSYVVSGVAAGIAGSVIGSGWLKILSGFDLSGIHLYKYYFLSVCLIGISALISILFLPKLKDWHMKSVINLLFSPRDLRALYAISTIKENTSAREDKKKIAKLEKTNSTLADSAIVDYLNSPHLYVRANSLQALRGKEFTQEIEKSLINQLKYSTYTTAYMAAEILGESGVVNAIPELRKTLDHEDFFLSGKSMVALARLGDTGSIERIRKIFLKAENPRLVIHGAIALRLFSALETFPDMLEKACDPALPRNVRHEVLCNAAEFYNIQDTLYTFFKDILHEKKEETEAFLLEKQTTAPHDDVKQIWLELANINTDNIKEIVNMLERLMPKERMSKLKEKLLDATPELVFDLGVTLALTITSK